MEESAYEALYIGISVFIFIVALTAAIILMNNVLNMVNYANKNAMTGMNGSLAETVGIVEERVYKGESLLTYYKKYLETKELAQEKGDESIIKTVYYVKETGEAGQEKSLEQFVKETNISKYITKTFELVYKGKSNNKDRYVFVENKN